MAPQTRSSTRRVTRSSGRAGEPSKASPVPRAAWSAPKTTRNRNSKALPKSNQRLERKPARKRPRRSNDGDDNTKSLPAKAPKRGRGKLQVFMNLPVEIFIEIAKYLHPSDLVLLSRVSKFFRELFMSRRATPVWRSARDNVPGLPPCPEDVCEPQYAAMLFTSMCSMCGKWAPRGMDPVLLVRLCAQCRENETVDIRRVTDPRLVFVSYELIPRSWARRCLLSDAKAVKAKLNELNAAGDQEAMRGWVEQRLKTIQTRQKNVQSLRQWLRNREREREVELDRVRGARQAEIELRLVELGWEQADLQPSEYWRRKQWNTLVFNTKSLTQRAWDELLPYLLGHLEMNRKQRLEREQGMRRQSREQLLQNWFGSNRRQIVAMPFARAIPQDGNVGESSASTPAVGTFGVYIIGKASDSVLNQPFPSFTQMRAWPEFKALLEDDVPLEGFVPKLEEKQEVLKESITTWRTALEAGVAIMMPENTREPDFDAPSFRLMVGDVQHMQPISSLPLDVKNLLRADATFMGMYSRLHFYPDDFMNTDTGIENVTYDAKASAIAKVLLNVLGRPDASYLELKAMGDAFRCGRCHLQPGYMNWRGIVDHYVEEARRWKSNCGLPRVRSSKSFTYTLTHDIDWDIPDKPLMRMIANDAKVPIIYSYGRRVCKQCERVRIPSCIHSDFIIDHVREVHLVEEPEEGKHYK